MTEAESPTLTTADRRSYDVHVFWPATKCELVINLWASNERRAASRAMALLGGEGAVQILSCQPKNRVCRCGTQITSKRPKMKVCEECTYQSRADNARLAAAASAKRATERLMERQLPELRHGSYA